MYRIFFTLIIVSFTIYLLPLLSIEVIAEPKDVNILNEVNDKYEVFSKINFKFVNDQKNKTLEDFEITLPNSVSDLKMLSDQKDIQFHNFSENRYKLTFTSPLYFNQSADIEISFKNLNSLQKIGKLDQLKIIGFDFDFTSNIINIDRKLGNILYTSCNCVDLENTEKYVLKPSRNDPVTIYFGTFQSFEINFSSRDINHELLDINLPDNDGNQLVYYDSQNTIPNKIIYNQNFNLYAEFNSVQNIDFKYYVIREKLGKNEISKTVENLYTEFLTKYNYCKNNLAEECRNFNLVANFQLILNNNSVNSRIVSGYQYDYFSNLNRLSYWLEIAGENGIHEIDPFLQIQTDFDFFFQKDPNRFKIYNYGDNISLFKEGIYLPKQMSIGYSQGSVKVEDNVIESRVIKKTKVSEKIPDNYFLLFTNKSSQVITLKDIKLSPINSLVVSNNDKIYIYPGNSIELDLGSFFEDLKISTNITYSYKLNDRWVSASFNIDKSSWIDEEKVTFITISGYIILISLSIFFGLWLVVKREV